MMLSAEAVVTVQETERQQARDIRVRRLVPALRDLVSKVDRCLYTDVFRREVSPTEIISINVDVLNRFEDNTDVTVELLLESGAISAAKDGVKILGGGELTKKLNVKANAFSASAKEKIEAAGGTVEVI